jgi:aminopeptidase
VKLVEGTPWSERELKAYSQRLLDIAQVRAGDIFALIIDDESQEPLASALADACALTGVLIDVICRYDEGIASAQMQRVVLERGVVMSVQSYHPRSRHSPLSGKAFAAYDEAVAANDLRWNVAVCPTPAWARSVYPELDADAAFRALGQDLLSFVRLRDDDGDDAWEAHIERLRVRAHALNEARVQTLHLRGEHTRLSLNLLEGAKYLPTEWETQHGQRICVNAPTEEIFTTPDPTSVEGEFMTSKPLVLNGQVISNISGRIVRGRVVELRCEHKRHQQLLNQAFSSDPGMLRVGEIGLVDVGSRIGSRERVYNHGILDENAGTHLGFGQSYEAALSERALSVGQHGNEASAHIDLIIGDATMDVEGVTADGKRLSIIRRGRCIF